MESDNIKSEQLDSMVQEVDEAMDIDTGTLEDNLPALNQYTELDHFVGIQSLDPTFEHYADEEEPDDSIMIHKSEDDQYVTYEEQDDNIEHDEDYIEHEPQSDDHDHLVEETEHHSDNSEIQEISLEHQNEETNDHDVECIIPDHIEPKIIQQTPVTQTRMIAPKPLAPKLLNNAGSPQIIFIQTPSGTNQAIRLVSSNQNSTQAPVKYIKTSDGNIVQIHSAKPLQTITKKIAPAPTNKNIITKVLVKGNQQSSPMVLSQKPDQSGNTIKLIPVNAPTSSGVKISSPTKTITFAQAQQMGLIRGKFLSPTKLGVKPPPKILPAPAPGLSPLKNTQKVLIQQGGQLRSMVRQPVLTPKPTVSGTTTQTVPTALIRSMKQTVPVSIKSGSTVLPTQVIKIPTGQTIASNQIHQINVPGRGVQYVRLVSQASGSQLVSSKLATSISKAPTIRPATTGLRTFTAIRPAISTSRPTGAKTTFVRTMARPMTTTTILPKVSTEGGLSATNNTVKVLTNSVKPQGRVLMPAGSKTSGGVTTISASTLSQLQGAILPNSNNGVQQLVVVPAHYMQQLQAQRNKVSPDSSKESIMDMDIDLDDPIEDRMPHIGRPPGKNKRELTLHTESTLLPLPEKKARDLIEANGIRPRKPCNCTKSQCLKLYCDCFANGEFCNNCNCKECFNNISNEEERQKAIRSCLERNPSAFRPKIGKAKDPGLEAIRRHNKGCNCKRSGCLKNYCECFEAKIACSNNCKCVGCRNIEECLDRKRGRNEEIESGSSHRKHVSSHLEYESGWPFSKDSSLQGNKWPVNYVTADVIEATCQCLLAQADDAEKAGLDETVAVDQIIEEFGRCLVEIIQCFNRSKDPVTKVEPS